MIRLLITLSLILTICLSGCQVGGISDMPLFESSFEDEQDPFRGWATDQHCCSYSLQVTDRQSTNGSKSVRLEVRKTDRKTSRSIRSELVRKPHQQGVTRWYGFNMYLEDWVDDIAGEHVFQWHPNNLTGSATAALWTSSGRFIFQTNAGGSAGNIYHDLGPIESNRWIAWVIHARWANDTTGFLKVWKDGELVMDRKHFITCPPEGIYFKLGINKFGWEDQPSSTNRRVLYFDEVRIGDEAVDFDQVDPESRINE